MGDPRVSASLPMAQARARMSELVERVRRTREPVMLTRNGRPVAVLVDPDEWALAAAALAAAEDVAAVREYDEATAEWDGTGTVGLAEVMAEREHDEAAASRAAG